MRHWYKDAISIAIPIFHFCFLYNVAPRHKRCRKKNGETYKYKKICLLFKRPAINHYDRELSSSSFSLSFSSVLASHQITTKGLSSSHGSISVSGRAVAKFFLSKVEKRVHSTCSITRLLYETVGGKSIVDVIDEARAVIRTVDQKWSIVSD